MAKPKKFTKTIAPLSKHALRYNSIETTLRVVQSLVKNGYIKDQEVWVETNNGEHSKLTRISQLIREALR